MFKSGLDPAALNRGARAPQVPNTKWGRDMLQQKKMQKLHRAQAERVLASLAPGLGKKVTDMQEKMKNEREDAKNRDYKWYLAQLKPYYLEDAEYDADGRVMR